MNWAVVPELFLLTKNSIIPNIVTMDLLCFSSLDLVFRGYMMCVSWYPSWCQPPSPRLNISTPYSKIPVPLYKTHHVSTSFLYLLFFFWNNGPSLFLALSFIKPFKTSDFSKDVPHVMKLWYYTWKHSQTYYNKVYYTYKSLCRSKSSKMKLRDLHYTSDKNQSDSKLCQKVIILKVLEKIIYINYKLQSCSNFGNLMLLLYSNIDIWKHSQYYTTI